jgi:hypothetical protein
MTILYEPEISTAGHYEPEIPTAVHYEITAFITGIIVLFAITVEVDRQLFLYNIEQ